MRGLDRQRCDGIEPGPEEFSVENYRRQFPLKRKLPKAIPEYIDIFLYNDYL
jgi:hypothetical protein